MSTLYVFENADAAASAGKTVDNVTVFTSILDAVKGASTTEATTILVASGNYTEDLTITLAEVGEQKADITIKNATSSDVVNIEGQATFGYFENRVGAANWNAKVTLQGLNMTNSDAAEKSCLDIQSVNELEVIGCTLDADTPNVISSPGNNSTGGAIFTNCTITGNVSLSGMAKNGSTWNNCHFYDNGDSIVNVQGGNAVTFNGCDFNATLTDACDGNSFYCIRSNNTAIILNDCEFIVTDELTAAPADTSKWGLLWQRQTGANAASPNGAPTWTAQDCVFNIPESAVESGLLLNLNGTTNADNAPARVTLTNPATPEGAAELETLIGATSGFVNVLDGENQTYTRYENGVPVEGYDGLALDTFYVNSSYTAASAMPAGQIFGVNAFSSIKAALQQSSLPGEIVVLSDITDNLQGIDLEPALAQDLIITADKAVNVTLTNGWFVPTSSNNSKLTIGENVTFRHADNVLYLGYYGKNFQLDVDGTLSARQLWMGVDTTVSATGKLVSNGEAFVLRRGASVTINGDDAKGAAKADRTAQIEANYFSLLSGELILNDTLVTSGPLWTDNSGGYANEGSVYIGLDNTIWDINGNIKLNGSNVLMEINGGSTVSATLQDGWGISYVNSNTHLWVAEGSTLNIASVTVQKGGEIDICDADFNVTNTQGVDVLTVEDGGMVYFRSYKGQSNIKIEKLVNNSEDNVIVDGQVSMDIDAMEGNALWIEDGSVIVDSDVAGNAFIGGNVTFRGDNKFNMLYDFGELKDYYGTSANMQWTVEAGASLNLTQTSDRYGLGYGDNVKIYGELDDALAARESLTEDDASFSVNGIAMMNGGWANKSYFSVEDAYVILARNAYFGTKTTGKGGDYTVTFDNSVVDITRTTIYSGGSNVLTTATNSDIYLSGTWFSDSTGSTLTLNGSKLSATGKNGTDSYNLNSGEMTFTDSEVTFTDKFTNKGTVAIDDSTFTGSIVANEGSMEVSGESTVKIDQLTGNSLNIADGTVLTDTVITDGSVVLNGSVTFKGDNKIVMANNTLSVYDGSGDKIFVDKDATLVISRPAFGSSEYWDIDGTIADARTASTADEKVSLRVLAGLSLNGGSGDNSTLNVDNAYVVFEGSTTSKTSSNGNFDLNFTNSIADFGSLKFQTNGSNKAVFDVDFVDSVLNVSSHFVSAQKGSTLTFDNSSVYVGSSFRNDADFELLNGSEMTVKYYINESSGNAGMSGNFTLDESTADFMTGRGHELFNRGTLTLKNGSEFTTEYLTNENTIAVSGDSTINVETQFVNNGTVTVSGDSTLVLPNLTNTGLINIDVADMTGDFGKVLDSISDAFTLDNIGKIALVGNEDLAYQIIEYKGDIYTINVQNVYVNAAWADGAYAYGDEIAEGKFFGINAFSSFGEAAALTEGSRTFHLAVTEGTNANLNLTFNGLAGNSSDITISGCGISDSQTIAADGTFDKVYTINGENNTGYVTITVNGAGADYLLNAKFVEANTPDIPVEVGPVEEGQTSIADGNTVSMHLNAATYTFTVGANELSEFTLDLTNHNNSTVYLEITDALGNRIFNTSSSVDIQRTLPTLAAGDYTIKVDVPQSATAAYETQYDLYLTKTDLLNDGNGGSSAAYIKDADDTRDGANTAATAITDWVGKMDSTDWYKLDMSGFAAGDSFKATLEANGTGVRATVVKVQGGVETAVGNLYTSNISNRTFAYDDSYDYYVKFTNTASNSAKSVYSMSIASA